MNRKTLSGLAVAALVAIVAAFFVDRRTSPESDTALSDAYLVPGLRDHVNDVDRIVVRGAGDHTIATLARGGQGWTLAEKGGYAVDTGTIRQFLLKLADARRVEQKTSAKDKYAALAVDDISAKDAKGIEVDIDGAGKPVKLIIGMADARGGTFVRDAGDAASWLTGATLTVPRNATDWLAKDIADIAEARIASVEVTHAGGDVLRITKVAPSDPAFAVEGLAKGDQQEAAFEANALAGALAQLRFDDVIPAKDAPSADKPLTATFRTFDGLVIDATLWSRDGKDDAQFKATLDSVAALQGIAADQAKANADFGVLTAAAAAAKASKDSAKSEAADAPIKPLSVSDPSADKAAKLAALNKQVAALNARFDGWTFVLPAYKYAAMNKLLADFRKRDTDRNAAPETPAKTKAAKPPVRKPVVSKKKSAA